MEFREALSQIAEIRQQMARTEVFRGFRSLPVAFSGVLAWGRRGPVVLGPGAVAAISRYLTLWIGAAALGIAAAGVGDGRSGIATGLAVGSRDQTWQAVEQFLPCLVAGGLLTLSRPVGRGGGVWMLPGLWSILFSLGIFASGACCPGRSFGWRLLPGRGPGLPGPGPGRVRCRPGRWACRSAAASCSRRPCSIGRWSGTMATNKPSAEGGGRFAYEGLERIIHEKARLGS